MPEPVTTAIAAAGGIKGLWDITKDLFKTGAAKVQDVMDAGNISLPAYAKPLRICSRVYMDEASYSDPIITDVIKTIHTQYAGFVLNALQMNQLVTRSRTVQDMLRVVATEDNKPHESIVGTLFSAYTNPAMTNDEREDRERRREKREEERAKREEERHKREAEKVEREKKEKAEKAEHDKVEKEGRDKRDIERTEREKEKERREKEKHVDEQKRKKTREDDVVGGKSSNSITGKVVSLAGDNHVPAGKLIEVTLTNPEDPLTNKTVTLLIQLAPYRVPEPVAVQMLIKDVVPSFFQRVMQWRTSEISFWRDLIFMTDIVKKRERLMKMDPTGILADHVNTLDNKRFSALNNLSVDKANRARNIANSVVVVSRETVQRAKAESGVDITRQGTDMSDAGDRQRFFATSFAMMLVVIDVLYNQVTFYYNGLDDSATFSFDQIQVSNKGGGGLDLVSVLNALGQGRAPKF